MKLASLLLATALAVSPALADETGVTDNTIRIGMFGPLTGSASLYGNIILGSQALYKDVNDHGGINGRKIELFVEDDGCNSLQGIAAVKKLISDSKVFLINGGVCSGVALAAKPEIIKSGLPWMVAGAAATEISTPTVPTIFQASPTAADNSKEMIDFAMTKAGTDKIAIITQTDDWGKSYHDPALEYLQSKYHIKPILDVQMASNAMDSTSQMLQIRNSGAQFVLAMLYPAPFAVFVRDAYKFGVTTPLLGNSGVTLSDTLKRVGTPAAMNNVYVYYHLAGNEDGPELAHFADIWRKYYPDKPVNNYSYVGMAGTLSIIHVLQGLGHDVTRARFIEGLEKLQNFDSGVEAGPTTFSAEQHDGTTAGFMSTLRGGKILLLRTWADQPAPVMLLQLVTTGLSQGSIYALVALGMTVLFRATTIVDFGHGELFMGGAFAAYVLVHVAGLSFAAAALVAVLIMFLVGVLIERVLIRPMGDASHTAVAMMTVAFSFLFKGVARWFFGGDVLSVPPVFSYPPILLGSIVLTVQDVLITVVTLSLVVMFLLLFQFSRLGRMGRAAAASPRGAVLVGINLPALSGSMWGVSAALGGVAGILVAPVSLIFPDMGGDVLLPAFAAMTLGGFGHFGGAIAGGLLIGVLQQLAGGYVSSTVITILPYLVIVGVLFLFPAGLFGSKETQRV